MRDFFNLSDGRGSRLPDLNQINEAVLSSDPDAARKLGEAHAADLVRGTIRRTEHELAEAEERTGRLTARLDTLEQERRDAITEQHLSNEVPPDGKRQPFWQRVYNGGKCVFAILAPLSGIAYLVSAMQDTSFSFSQNPMLAVLAAGPIVVISFGGSSWALKPSDVRRAERRSDWLLRLGMLTFVLWAGFMAMRFGPEPITDLGLAAGFDPTAGNSAGGSFVLKWLQVNGIAVGALFTHLLAEALLSAGCISSALLAGRKVLVVDSAQTSHGKLLDDAIDDVNRQLRLQGDITADIQFRLNQATATHKAVVEEVTHAVLAKREDLEARKTAALEDVRKSFLQR